jgi:hypothetical protein
MSLLVIAFAVTVSFNFEGGSLGRVERVSDAHFRCAVAGETDQDNRNRQATWYYFRVDGARGRALTIDIVGWEGEYNYRPTRNAITGDTIPFYSEDQRQWQPVTSFEYDADALRLRLKLTPQSNQVWIAHVPPYTNQDLAALLKEFARHPHLKREVIGRTVQKRELLLLTVTDASVADAGKKVVWLMARQHSWEAFTSWAAEGALRYLLSDDAAARRIRRETVLKILPLNDPDGVARGGVRFNAHGYDLNRNWDVPDSPLMPEIAAQRRAVLKWADAGGRVDLFLTLHNTETSEYLDGPPDAEGKHRELTERFFKLLVERTAFAPSRPPQPSAVTTTEGRPGRMTVVQGLWRDRRIPAFLMEQRIARSPKLGRVATIEDRMKFGADLVRVLWEVVRQENAARQ